MIDAANDTEYGLACHIFTENVSRAVRVAHAIEAGTSWVCAISYFASLVLSLVHLLLLPGQLCRVWARGGSFGRVQTVRGGEGVGEACAGYVRSFSLTCVGMLMMLLFMCELEGIRR